MPPPAFSCWKIVFLVNTLLRWLLSGAQSPTMALPLDPAGGLLSPPKQISGYAPVTESEHLGLKTKTIFIHEALRDLRCNCSP